jgi:hypothetical protein
VGVVSANFGHARGLVKSAGYARSYCPSCHNRTDWVGRPPGSLYASREVGNWVAKEVAKSELILSLSGRCSGCADVYEDKARVLGNLLYKLGLMRTKR